VDGKGCASAAYRSNVTELASLRLRQSAGQTLCKHRIVESQGETHSHAQTEPLGQVNVLGTIDRYHHFVCGDLPRQLLDSQRLGFRARIAQVNVASLGDREEDNRSAIWRETRSPHHTIPSTAPSSSSAFFFPLPFWDVTCASMRTGSPFLRGSARH
jgi:hypothetical protein